MSPERGQNIVEPVERSIQFLVKELKKGLIYALMCGIFILAIVLYLEWVLSHSFS